MDANDECKENGIIMNYHAPSFSINTCPRHFGCWKKIPIHCINVILTGQQHNDLLPAMEMLIGGLIFIGSTGHVILTSPVVAYNIVK